ncbi:TIGR02206 family membrane protein [Clostridium botulinum]|nr:TIGR02206 family membrane protein [Clostridium haemolyticum]NFV48240.1 TIGR02206 family membrane protein [Clostridium botulinum]
MTFMKYSYIYLKSINDNIILCPFSISHIVCITIIFTLCFIIYFYRNTLKKTCNEKFVSHIIAFILVIHQISIYTWYLLNNKLTLKECLPLYPCRISIILCIIIMYNKSKKIFDLLYFWGIGGATIALLFHDNSLYPFPHYMFIQFFISHGGILISVIFMMFIHNYRPNLTSLKITFKWTLVYFSITIPTNYLIGSNYCYLIENPNLQVFKFLNKNSIIISFSTITSFFILFYLLYLPYKNKISS